MPDKPPFAADFLVPDKRNPVATSGLLSDVHHSIDELEDTDIIIVSSMI